MANRARACVFCGRSLALAVRSDALYCSPRCRTKARRARISPHPFPRACPVCGRPVAAGSMLRADAVYDRGACRARAWRARHQSVTDKRSATTP